MCMWGNVCVSGVMCDVCVRGVMCDGVLYRVMYVQSTPHTNTHPKTHLGLGVEHLTHHQHIIATSNWVRHHLDRAV